MRSDILLKYRKSMRKMQDKILFPPLDQKNKLETFTYIVKAYYIGIIHGEVAARKKQTF
jgi:hypothetical protein